MKECEAARRTWWIAGPPAKAIEAIRSRRFCGSGRTGQSRASAGIGDRQIAQNLAINLNSGGLQTVNKLRIFDAVVSAGRADAHNPKLAKIALLLTAVAEGVLPRFHHLFVGDFEIRFFSAPIAFGLLQDFFMTLVRHRVSFYACHIQLPRFVFCWQWFWVSQPIKLFEPSACDHFPVPFYGDGSGREQLLYLTGRKSEDRPGTFPHTTLYELDYRIANAVQAGK